MCVLCIVPAFSLFDRLEALGYSRQIGGSYAEGGFGLITEKRGW